MSDADSLPERPRSLGALVVYQGTGETLCTRELATEICLALMEGKTLRKICRGPGMPTFRTVMNWLHDEKYSRHATVLEFRRMHARARPVQMDTWADEIIEIADDGSNDWYEDEDGRIRLNGEHVARSKLRIDTRLRLMGSLARRKYGTAAPRDDDPGGVYDAPIIGDAAATPAIPDREKARRVAFLMGHDLKQSAPAPVTTPAEIVEPEVVDEVDEDWFGDDEA